MIFDELDKKMRIYEQSLDQVLLSEMYMVARLDGRGFTKLTKEVCKYEAPFDVRFRDIMVNTTKALMNCGFRVIYAFTESDEISLLFDKNEDTFGRKVRKYNSTLAGEASAAFSLEQGMIGTFDCRMVPLPNAERVEDYFRVKGLRAIEAGYWLSDLDLSTLEETTPSEWEEWNTTY